MPSQNRSLTLLFVVATVGMGRQIFATGPPMPLLRKAPPLLLAFRRGDHAALEETYRFFARPTALYLGALARKAGRGEMMQAASIGDLLQDVFVKAFSERARLSYDGLRDFGPFLTRIARNCFIDSLRRHCKEIPVAPEELVVATNELAIDELYEPNIARVIQHYVVNLPQALQGIYEQRYVRGLSQKNVCNALGLTRRQLRTGEQHLRQGLRKAIVTAGLLEDVEAAIVNRVKVRG